MMRFSSREPGKRLEEIAAANYDLPALKVGHYEARARRAEAFRRVAKRKGVVVQALAAEEVRS